MRNRLQSCFAGFTLVELLVVISIIALLLAILMPSLQKARAQAQKVVCSSNEKQLFVAFNMYSMENAGILVPNPNNYINGNLDYTQAARSWDSSLASQFQTKKNDTLKKYIVCPADKKIRVKDPSAIYKEWEGSGEVLKRSYATNVGLYNLPVTLTGVPEISGNSSSTPANILQVARPGETILLMDMQVAGAKSDDHFDKYGNVQGTNHYYYWSKPYTATAKSYGRFFKNGDMHKDGGDWLFIDGHVEWHGFNYGVDFATGQPYKGLRYPDNWQYTKKKGY